MDPLKDGRGDFFISCPRLATRLAQSNTSAVIMVGSEGEFLRGGDQSILWIFNTYSRDDWNGSIFLKQRIRWNSNGQKCFLHLLCFFGFDCRPPRGTFSGPKVPVSPRYFARLELFFFFFLNKGSLWCLNEKPRVIRVKTQPNHLTPHHFSQKIIHTSHTLRLS